MNLWSKKPLPVWRKRLSIVLWIVFLSFIAFIVFNPKFPILLKYGFTSKGYHEMLRTSNDPDIRFGNFSPDGSKVILKYGQDYGSDKNIFYIGILDITTHHLNLIRAPQNYERWYDGSFLANGKKMIFSFISKEEVQNNNGLGILNLDTLTYEIILRSDVIRRNISFSQTGDRIIYSVLGDNINKDGKSVSYKSDIYEMDLATKKETRLTNFHYYVITGEPRYFPDGEKYIFAAEYPYFGYGDYSMQRHTKLYQQNNTYIFNRNTLPTEAIPSIIHKDHSSFKDLSADGKKILLTALSDLHKTNPKGMFNYELFMYEDNQIKQLTDLQWMIIDAALSPDAKKAVFVADTLPSRGSERQIWLLDIDRNTTSRIEIKPENITWIDVK